jgi:hypothetical protein
MGQVQRLYEPLAEWQMERLPQRSEGYTLDLDSTVFERYGKQEGSLKGHNPRKHGRPSHHPLLAALGEAHFLLHGWLRSGNCGTARGVEEFLKEALALWGQRRLVVHLSESWGGLKTPQRRLPCPRAGERGAIPGSQNPVEHHFIRKGKVE